MVPMNKFHREDMPVAVAVIKVRSISIPWFICSPKPKTGNKVISILMFPFKTKHTEKK